MCWYAANVKIVCVCGVVDKKGEDEGRRGELGRSPMDERLRNCPAKKIKGQRLQ